MNPFRLTMLAVSGTTLFARSAMALHSTRNFMIRFAVTVLMGVVALAGYAAELEGTWKSDADLTMAFNRANARLTEKQEKFLSEILGKLTVTYKNGTVYSSMPSTRVTVSGEPRDLDGFSETAAYKIMAQDQDTIVLRITEHDGTCKISLLKFETEDRFWIYLPTSSNQWAQLHMREYFVRQK